MEVIDTFTYLRESSKESRLKSSYMPLLQHQYNKSSFLFLVLLKQIVFLTQTQTLPINFQLEFPQSRNIKLNSKLIKKSSIVQIKIQFHLSYKWNIDLKV